MAPLFRKIVCLLQCNQKLNRKAIHMKRCWDEVSAILDRACECHCGKRGKH